MEAHATETPEYHSYVMFDGVSAGPPWCRETAVSRTAVRLIQGGSMEVPFRIKTTESDGRI